MKPTDDLEYYLVGYKNSPIGYSNDKRIVKELVKERGKPYSYIKVKNKKAKLMIENSLIPEIVCLEGHLLFDNEEPDFIEGFDQYQIDFVRYAENFMELLKYIKFSEDEVKHMKNLVFELRDYIEAMEHGSLYENETEGVFEYFNYEAAIRWYKNNVLGVGAKE